MTEEGRGASPRDREAPEQHLDLNRANRRSRWEDVWVRPRPEGGDVPHALRRETGRGACRGGRQVGTQQGLSRGRPLLDVT